MLAKGVGMSKVKLVLAAAVLSFFTVYAQNEPHALGADISHILQREKEGVKYYRNGQAEDLLLILKASGFNYIRLRLFVDPTAKVTEDTPNSDGWSASPYSTAGYCGLDSTIKVAKRVKAAGMKFLLDFHYSDTWADPGKQYKPMSWRNINNLADLAAKVRSYTKESLEKFRDNGALPDMVQVGNEVVGGMIHPDGQGNTQNFATLVNAGINGVKDVDASIKIMMHTINEKNPNGWLTTLKSNLNKVEANAANKIDVIGLSYYPKWHGNLDSLSRVLTALKNTHTSIKIAVVEYADKHREVNDLVWALPVNQRLGTFVWEPEEFDGDNSLPLFDWKSGANSGRHSNARLELYPPMANDFGLTGASSSSIEASSSSIASSSSSNAASSSSAITTPVLYGVANSNLVMQSKNGINLTAASGAVVEVFNLAGERLAAPRHFAGGVYSLSFGHLPNGIYVVKVLFQGGETKLLRILVIPH
jgi:arabinogalactan endo-1,4-beta-galactosidase